MLGARTAAGLERCRGKERKLWGGTKPGLKRLGDTQLKLSLGLGTGTAAGPERGLGKGRQLDWGGNEAWTKEDG